jgi:hypothetical protein
MSDQLIRAAHLLGWQNWVLLGGLLVALVVVVGAVCYYIGRCRQWIKDAKRSLDSPQFQQPLRRGRIYQ